MSVDNGIANIEQFSVYKKIWESENNSVVTIEYVIDSIRSDKLKAQTESIRIVNGNGNEKAYKELKGSLPVASFNGAFKKGISVKNDSFEKSSGIFHIDIDNVNAPAVFSTLCGMETILFAFISPSGCGVKAGIRINPDDVLCDDDFKQAFKQVDSFFSDLGVSIDTKCKDVRRACFLCHDANAYYNHEASVFDLQEFEDEAVINNKPVAHEEYIQNNYEDKIFSVAANILLSSGAGRRHGDRVSAARLLGGYVASGQLHHSRYAELVSISDQISDKGITDAVELKTLRWAYEQGLTSPVIFGRELEQVYADSATVRAGSKDNGVDADAGDTATDIISKPEIQDWNHSLSDDIDYIIPFDCVARDIQQFILSRSMYPQPAFAYAASMVVVGTCIGRDLRYDNIKGNMMFIAMLESGGGKDFPFKMAKKILQAVDYGHRVESKCASGVALFEALEEQPSLLLHIDEYGHYLDGINGKGANVYAKEIVTILTEAYTSGSDSISGKRTKGCDPIVIPEPNINVFGMSTERQIFDGLRSSDVADGSLARYMMLFGVEKLMPKRVIGSYDAIPKWLIDKLNKLIDNSKHEGNSSVDLRGGSCSGFDNAKWALDLKARKASITAKNPSFSPFYNRVAVRAVQGCLLADKCQSVETLEWFADIEFKTIDVFVKKFNHLSADNENERLFKLLEKVIKETGKAGVSAKQLLSKTRQIPSYVRRQGLLELEETGTVHVELRKINGSQRSSSFYYWIK